MTDLPQDFLDLLPKQGLGHDGPPYVLWVFNPMTGKAIVENNEGVHEAERITHEALAQRVTHPDRVHGYAYPIQGGWRITDWDHKPVEDRYVINQVMKSLKDMK